ncbi:MAG: prepilin-type N-terminal cleavage/methylation domain-containing protein [Phycisphaerales bacterium]|nr:prepilin-type N-terminal cleavage/methylation domain-containing protein [Phycisphaerales bacterium]
MKSRLRHEHVGFTLIELLVVVAIIALLAAILMPSLVKAREQAKAVVCLSNMHNIGTSFALYHNVYQDYYPTAYSYVDGASSSNGYYHWTAALSKTEYKESVASRTYPKAAKQYICPSHSPGGWAPTNFTTWRLPDPPAGQSSQDVSDTVDDQQAPRLSYVVNEIIMPRKKFDSIYDRQKPPGTSNLCLVKVTEVESPSNTIAVAEFSNSANCIWGNSVGGGTAYKSHRPTNGIKSNQVNAVFDGEGYLTGTQVYKLSFAEAAEAIAAVIADKAAASVSHHISYTNPYMHDEESNYLFVDGHASRHSLKETLDPGYYMWGKRVYSVADKPIIDDFLP